MKPFERAIGLVVAIACLLISSPKPPRADEPAQALKYRTTWLGNTFGGGEKWVQNFAEDLCVLSDGTCVVGSFWDEAGREVGLYKDGQPIAKLQDTHMRGGKAITATDSHIYYAHTCAREDQPEVKAGEAPREKPICLFGVSRWTRDGKHAPFEGGVTRFKNMTVLQEALDNHDLIPRGLANDGKLLYVADTTADRIRVLDLESMKPLRDFAAVRPERLTVDKVGNIWAIENGGRRIHSYTNEGRQHHDACELPDGVIAASVGFAPDGRLMISDHGPRQQILFFDVSGEKGVLTSTFGDEGGMFSSPRPGFAGPLRFAMPTGAGFDAAGNFYVSCNPPHGGTVLRAFNPSNALQWELLGLEFLAVADAVPGSDGREVLTATNRYLFNSSAPAGEGWKWLGITLDPFLSPDDPRLHLSVLQCATSVRKLGGRPFLCQRGMWQGVLGIYRAQGDRFVPSVVMSSGPLQSEDRKWKPSGQPDKGRWTWRDLNGNARFDEGEYTPTEGPEGEFWASNVDTYGDIWQAGRDSGIWRWKFQGLDGRGNPRYNPKPNHWPMPAPFNDLLRTEYAPESDTLYLTGQTKDRPISNGEWGTAGTVLVRFDNWTSKPRIRYRVDLPYKPESTLMESFHIAGDLFFLVDCKEAKVFVHDNRTGKLLGTMKPGPEVHGESGWVDFRDGLRATRLDDGRYLVFVEEDYKAKVMAYLLDDPISAYK